MIAAASFSSASWISSRLSKQIRSLPKPANHPWGPLHHPAMLTQSLATLNASPGNAAGDAPLSQVRTATLVVIVLVGVQLRWSFAGAPSQACNRRNRVRSEEHTSELQSPCNLVCRLLLEK